MTPEECAAELENYRDRIDVIDRRIVELLNERARAVEVIGQVKVQARMRVYEPRREDAVYTNLAQANTGPLTDDSLKRIYERVIDEMRALQRAHAGGDEPAA